MLVFEESEKPEYPVVQTLYSAIYRINITIQRITVRETNCAIHWIEVYPVDGGTHLLINWGLEAKERTSNRKFNPHLALTQGFQPEPHL